MPTETKPATTNGTLQAPWLRAEQGRTVFGATTAKEAMKKAHLDWTVGLEEMQTLKGVKVPDRRAVVRSSDGAVLSTVGATYTPIQNHQAFELLDSQVKAGVASYDSAGFFDGGNRVWVLCKLKGELLVGKDVVEKYMLLHTAHDGSHRLKAFISAIRPVCKNTLNAALRRHGNDGISIGHTAKAEAQLKMAAAAMKEAVEYYKAFDAAAQRLFRTKFDEAKMKALAEHILPIKRKSEEDEKDSEPSAILQGQRDRIVELFTTGAGHKGIEGTGWAAFNAVAEWTDHHRSTRTDGNRLRSAWFGKGARLKREAFDYLLEGVPAPKAVKAKPAKKAAPAPAAPQQA